MLKARFILPAIISLLLVGGAAMAQTVDGGFTAPSTSNVYAASVNHQLVVHLPYVVALNIVGDGSSTDLTFNPSASDFYNNAQGSLTIKPVASGFSKLQAFTNDPANAALTVGATAATGNPSSSATVLTDVEVGTTSLTSFTDTVHPADGLKTVFSRSDVTLNLNGDEVPGDYTYTVTYTLTAN